MMNTPGSAGGSSGTPGSNWRGATAYRLQRRLGGIAHALKAIAKERSWRSRSHDQIRAVGKQIPQEFNHIDIAFATSSAEQMHRNFYENDADTGTTAGIMWSAESVLPDLEAIRNAPPRLVTIRTPAQRNNIAMLTGRNDVEIGDGSAAGFSNNHPDMPFQADDNPPGGLPAPGRPAGPGGGAVRQR